MFSPFKFLSRLLHELGARLATRVFPVRNMWSMSTSLTVGKARLATIVVHNPDGSVNTTATVTTSVGNPSVLRCTVNPSNPREIAIVGLAPSSGGVNANVSVDTGEGVKTSQSLIIVSAAAVVGMSGVDIGAFGAEIDPPAWA